MVSFKINGKDFHVDKKMSILDAALSNGVYIPHLCSHPDLSPAGVCGLCVVEIKDEDKWSIARACTTELKDGISIFTETELVVKLRSVLFDLILSSHQADCGTCPKYQNCELQSLKQFFKTEKTSLFPRSRMLYSSSDDPLFWRDPNKCVLCGRCVRACNELRGINVLKYQKEDGLHYISPIGGDLKSSGCQFCGACAEVCPTAAIVDRREFSDGKKVRGNVAPCLYVCPAGVDIPACVEYIARGKFEEAWQTLVEKVPLVRTLSYICHRPCESACRRNELNEALAIRELKRFLVEQYGSVRIHSRHATKQNKDHRIAVVGSGPSGLATAYYLARHGYDVHVFEAEKELGGMLRYGIPEYRLPKLALQQDIEDIEDLGVKFYTGTAIDDPEALKKEGFSAVILALGCQKGRTISIKGIEEAEVITGLEFLKAINSGRQPKLGVKGAVIGGGNVAIDCARTLIRLGSEAYVLSLEPESESPALREEVQQALEEGVIIRWSTTAREVQRNIDGTLRLILNKVSCVQKAGRELIGFKFDESHTEFLDVDFIILAVGQVPNVPLAFQREINEHGYLKVNPHNFMTNHKGIFATGDLINGPSNAVQAVGSGKGCALAVHRFLGGRGQVAPSPQVPDFPYVGRIQGFTSLKRFEPPLRPARDRIRGICSILSPWEPTSAVLEANRCLRCYLRFNMRRPRYWTDY